MKNLQSVFIQVIHKPYCEAIQALQYSINKCKPSAIGYRWDNENPRIQLEPRGERGYIELHPITKL